MRFRRKGAMRVAIDIAPLVDVVFLLVIFFAVSTTFLESSGLKLELPSSASTAERETSEIRVSLASDGRLEVDGETVELEDLRARLESILVDRDSKIVVLRADTATTHGDVVRVMDAIRESGAEGLTVAARPSASE